MDQTKHLPVMLSEAIDLLNVRPGGRYLDGTLGGGGHTAEMLRRSAPDGRVLSLDVDPKAIERFCRSFAPLKMTSRWIGVEANFRHLADVATRERMVPLDGILLDLGVSSDLLEDPIIGLSFQRTGPLDMRLGPASNDDGLTAAQIVNTWKEREIADLLREDGEERYATRIAAAIVSARKVGLIVTTTQLAEIIARAVPSSYERGRIHPATRTFQALRIAVNDELNALRDALVGARDVLAPHGRFVVISFHSLEDRIVKHEFKNRTYWSPLTKKPLCPTHAEIEQNPRARSAKLRAAEKNEEYKQSQKSLL